MGLWIGLVLTLTLSAAELAAQSNPFRPVIYVNDRVITAWELEQRALILRLFRTPGDIEEGARLALVNERLQLGAAQQLGVEVPEEALLEGMAEFAGRVELELEEFLQALAQQGVAEETFRDFVRAGISWREVVRARFGPRAQVTEAEVDRALALTSRRGGAEVLISEIIIPFESPEQRDRAEEIAAEITSNTRSESAFAAAARQYSAAPSRENGGRVTNVVPVSNLPPALRAQVLTLAPGQVSDPVVLGNAVAVFQLRQLRETGIADAENVSLEYARYLIPNGGTEAARAEAASIAARVDTCDDLFGVNFGQPAERLVIETQALQDVPQEIALELAKLDEGEISTSIVRQGTLVMLMLCGRTEIREEEVDRAQVRDRLVDQRLAAYADGYLAELRADAIIREP